jgi:hypothetical protein
VISESVISHSTRLTANRTSRSRKKSGFGKEVFSFSLVDTEQVEKIMKEMINDAQTFTGFIAEINNSPLSFATSPTRPPLRD